MPNIYGLIVWGSCLGAFILPIGLFIAALKRPRLAQFARISWLMLSILFCGISACVMNLTITEDLQAAIAVPYIQRALDAQCKDVTIVADTAGFILDPGFKWQSEGIVCYPRSSGWRCECNAP